MLSSRIHVLDYDLGVRTVIRADGGSLAIWRREERRRKGKCMEVSAFSDSRVLEDDEKTGVILPFDFEAPIVVFELCEGALDVLRLEFLWKSGQIKNAGDRGRETREVGGHCGGESDWGCDMKRREVEKKYTYM